MDVHFEGLLFRSPGYISAMELEDDCEVYSLRNELYLITIVIGMTPSTRISWKNGEMYMEELPNDVSLTLSVKNYVDDSMKIIGSVCFGHPLGYPTVAEYVSNQLAYL